MPLISTGARRYPHRARRIQRLKQLRHSPRDGHFAHCLRWQVQRGTASGLIHRLDFIHVVVRGSSQLAADRERLQPALARTINSSIHRLHVRLELRRAQIVPPVDRQRVGNFATELALQLRRPRIDPFQLEIRRDRRPHHHGHLALDHQHVLAFDPHHINARRQRFGNVRPVLAGARHAAGVGVARAVQNPRRFHRNAAVIAHRALDRAGCRIFLGLPFVVVLRP